VDTQGPVDSSDGNDDGGVAHCFFSVHLSTDYSNFPTIKTSVSNSSRHNNSCLREIQLAFDSRQATVAGQKRGWGWLVSEARHSRLNDRSARKQASQWVSQRG